MGEPAERVEITPANLAVLKNGRAKAVRFTTLAALCEALDCQPGDLRRWDEQISALNDDLVRLACEAAAHQGDRGPGNHGFGVLWEPFIVAAIASEDGRPIWNGLGFRRHDDRSLCVVTGRH